MSLASNLQTAFVRVATEFKTIRTLITGTATGDLSGLTTTNKTNLVAAINEAASAGGAQSLSQLTDVTVTSPVTGHLLRHNGSEFVNVLGTDHYQGADADLAAIAALTTTAYGRALLTTTDQAALSALIRFATEAVAGVTQYATTAQATAGTATDRAVHPAGLAAAIAGKANTSSLAAVATSGNAADLTGVLNTAQLPALAISSVQVVANAAARLALTNVQTGDVVKQTDTATTWILAAEPAATAANWVEMEANGDVLSVNGKTGTVVVTKADVGLGNVDNTSDAAKPISTATQTALDARQPLDADLTALAALATAADRLPYFTGPGAAALATFTAFGRSLIDDADAATARTTLSVYSQADIGNPETDFTATFVNALTA